MIRDSEMLSKPMMATSSGTRYPLSFNALIAPMAIMSLSQKYDNWGFATMDWGNLSAEEMTARFWQAIASGAYCTHGETFLDENDVLWWSKGGKLKGRSPERIKFLRDIVEALPAPLSPYQSSFFESMDNLPVEVKADFDSNPAGRSFEMAHGQQDHDDDVLMSACEHEYIAKAENESVLLKYYYQRCQAFDNVRLPDGKKIQSRCDRYMEYDKDNCARGSGKQQSKSL